MSEAALLSKLLTTLSLGKPAPKVEGVASWRRSVTVLSYSARESLRSARTPGTSFVLEQSRLLSHAPDTPFARSTKSAIAA